MTKPPGWTNPAASFSMPSLVAAMKQFGVLRLEFLRPLLMVGLTAFQDGLLYGQVVGFPCVVLLLNEQPQFRVDVAGAGLLGFLSEFLRPTRKPFCLSIETAVFAAQ